MSLSLLLISFAYSFTMVEGLEIHKLMKKNTGGPPRRLIHCNHGFGASSLSFEPILVPLAQSLDGVVLAHDAPGELIYLLI